jgi:hypothetical protein
LFQSESNGKPRDNLTFAYHVEILNHDLACAFGTSPALYPSERRPRFLAKNFKLIDETAVEAKSMAWRKAVRRGEEDEQDHFVDIPYFSLSLLNSKRAAGNTR